MSMTTFMIWQMIGIFCAYFGVTLILPLVVFRSLLKGRTITNQILFSFLIGNFYIITMVQVLQLLKISHTVTLILATVIPAYVVWVKLNKVAVGEVATNVGENVKRLTEKHLGVKTATYRIANLLKKTVKRTLRSVRTFILINWLEVLLQVILIAILLWVYGVGIVQQYGYSASDIPVHNYWINAMGENNIFVAGVYPHGYHCMVYYLHEVFGIDTYLILSQFAFVQVVGLHFALLYFLRLCCRTKYVPYIGAFLYAMGNFFKAATYSRFPSTLPQEFGMIFILPAIYYGFEFFSLRYEEVKKGDKKKESLFSLFGFAMSFGLTLSAHFYNTIIAGLFCVAMAIGYIFLFVRKQYFGNVVITCFISVMVAILPMGVAFATGTPLQGSLYWARNVIFGSDEETDEEENAEETEQSEEVNTSNIQNNMEEEQTGEKIEIQNAQDGKNDTDIKESPTRPKQSLKEKLSLKLMSVKASIEKMNRSMNNHIWLQEGTWQVKFFWGSVLFLLVAGVINIVFKKVCYGAMLVSDAIYGVLMLIILASGSLGLPRLMDPARSCIYFAYSMPILLVMPIDAVVGLIPKRSWGKKIGELVSLFCFLLCFACLIGIGGIRKQVKAGGFQTREAVTCLTNIIHQEKDFMWTICSANDELRMGEDHGYHYETITFLKKMENWNKDKTITIPTPKVYFFIEKIPLDYAVKYDRSGQSISEEGARGQLSYSNGLAPYQGENRWITMSRMYYWAQEFQRMYPNEMKVYMENDNFVCYVLEQNTYNLINLAIDYGYNTEE